MAKSALIVSRSTASIAASTSVYFPLIMGGGNSTDTTTEANAQVTWRTGGTLSNLFVVVTSNNRGTSTLTSRKAAGAGAQSVSITSSTTGTFEDTTNSETITAADLWNTKLATGSGGTSFIATVIGAIFNPTTSTNTLTKHGFGSGQSRTGNALTRYFMIQGVDSNLFTSTETDVKYKIRTAGTWANMNVNVTTNSRAGVTTLKSRVNTALGTQVVSITAGVTGVYEDTTHSDTIADADLLDIQYDQATGGGTLVMQNISSELTSTASRYQLITGGQVYTLTAGATNYMPIAGNSYNGVTTESNAQSKINLASTLSNLFAIILTNTVLATSTVKSRIGGADGNQVLSIGTLATGAFEDTTHSDTITTASLVNYQVITGAGGTNIQPSIIGIRVETLSTLLISQKQSVGCCGDC